MREYNPVSVDMPQDRLRDFIINNLNAISASIKSILTQVRVNKKGVDNAIQASTIQAWTTANRPTQTTNLNVIGINTTTGNLNYTTDNGATWKNYDGTAA